mmetsp:Transcript_28981/g.81636  ORF Transcript_28981/g.81636 Transcript_28981/m.81636 type:complete len:202 (-) Transcript_28981:111-716(-)
MAACSQGHLFRYSAKHRLHHGEVLHVLVSLKQGVPGNELNDDAAYAPHVARVGPAQPKDDLWRSVMPCRDNRGVVLLLKSSAPKVNQSQSIRLRDAFSNPGVVADLLVPSCGQEYVLGLQIRVHKRKPVQVGHSLNELERKALDIVHRERLVPVLAEEVKQAGAKLLKRHADVAAVGEPLQQRYAVPVAVGVVPFQGVQHL